MPPQPIRRASQGVTVASYGYYEEAQRTIDRLSDEGFAVGQLSIVAEDLRFVERATGRYDLVADEAVADEAARLARLLALLGPSGTRPKERVGDQGSAYSRQISLTTPLERQEA